MKISDWAVVIVAAVGIFYFTMATIGRISNDNLYKEYLILSLEVKQIEIEELKQSLKCE